MARKPNSETHEDLPVLTAKEVIKHYNPSIIEEELPKRYLMEANEFLRSFNCRGGGGELMPEYCTSRRTLQFYSSPQARLMPLPVYRNRHTAHYIVPDHFNRLAAITFLRFVYYAPIKLIRQILEIVPEDKYSWIENWPGTVRDMVKVAPMLRLGFTEQDTYKLLALNYLKGAHQFFPYELPTFFGMADWAQEIRKKELSRNILFYADDLADWITRGSGIKFLMALAADRREKTGNFMAQRKERKNFLPENR